MKRYLVPALVLALQSPALAASASSYNNLQLVLLLAANLLVGGLILFCSLVLGAVCFDKWRARKQTVIAVREERPEQARRPRGTHRTQPAPGTPKAAAFSR